MLTLTAPHLVIAAFAALLVVAALTDLIEYRIPNHVALAVAALWPLHLAFGGPLAEAGWAVLMALAVFAGGLLFYARGWMGAGDVKLAAAVALWAGPAHAMEFLVFTSLAGGVMGLVMASPRLRYGLAIMADSTHQDRLRDLLLADILPYGVAIAVGGLALAARLAA